MNHYDIAVVGAGLVGSSAVCALAQLKPELKLLLVDGGPESKPLSDYSCNEPSVESFDPRVVALTQKSKQLLQQVGAWSLIQTLRTGSYTDMQVWDGEGTGHIEFDCSEVQQSNLGHIVENRIIVAALSQIIQQHSNITYLPSTRVEDIHAINDYQQLKLDNAEFSSANLVLACDGALSPLREKMQLSTREWDYGHNAIVATIKTELGHEQTARQRFMSTGPLAYLPLGGDPKQQYCSIVWSCQEQLSTSLMTLNNEEFCGQVAVAMEHRLGEVVEVSKRFCIPLRQRHAVDYIKPGFALAGDAAHTIHPLAGQGVNLGVQDIIAFVCEVSRAIERGVSLTDPSILNRYQRSRKADNLTMMATMEGFKQLFGSKDISLRWLRNEGMKLLNQTPVLKNSLIKQAMGL